MKQKLATVFFAIIALILLFPVYYRSSVFIEAKVQAPDSTRVRISYKSGTRSDFVLAKLFFIEKKQTLRFSIDTNKITALKIDFAKSAPEKTRVRLLKTITDKVRTLYPSVERTYKKVGMKRNKTYIYDDFRPIYGKKTFRFLPFFICLGCVSVLSVLFLRFEAVRVLSAATAGYIGLSLNCDLNLSQTNALFGILIFLFLFFFFKRLFFEKPVSPPVFAAGIVFGALNILATRLYLSNSFFFITRHPLEILVGVIGEAVFFHSVFVLISERLRPSAFFKDISVKESVLKYLRYYERKTVFCSFMMICTVWLFFHLFYYPDFFIFDARPDGIASLPFDFSTLPLFLFTLLFNTGNALFNAELGCRLYMLFVMIVSAGLSAVCMNDIRRLGFNPYYQAACLLFFSVYPVGAFFNLWGEESLLYAATAVFFVLRLFSLTISEPDETKAKHPFLLYFAAGTALCLSGVGGALIAVFSIAGTVCFSKASPFVKKKIVLLSLLSFALFGAQQILTADERNGFEPDGTTAENIRTLMKEKASLISFIPVFEIGEKRTSPVRSYLPEENPADFFFENDMAFSLLYTGLRLPVYLWLLVVFGFYAAVVGRKEVLFFLFPAFGGIAACILLPEGNEPSACWPVIVMTPAVLSFYLAGLFNDKNSGEGL